MWRVLFISFLTSFVSGGFGIAIPLILLNRNVSLTDIGIILSILPVVFLFVRIFLAALADQIGWSPIFLANWIALSSASIIYLTANSPLLFATGKILEGISASAYWAVSRTATYMLSPRREAGEATKVIATVTLGGALGNAITGFIMSKLNFNAAMILLIAASMLLIFPTVNLWSIGRRSGRISLKKALKSLDPRGRGEDFWHVSLIMGINSLSRYPLLTLILPIFMSNMMGYDYMDIGLTFMIYNIISALTVFTTLRISLNLARTLIQSIIYMAVCVSLPVIVKPSPILMAILMISLAFANGLGARFFETIIAMVSKDRKDTLSIDIGILHIPMRIVEFSSLILFSLLVERYGYILAFIIPGVAYTAFSTLSYFKIKRHGKVKPET